MALPGFLAAVVVFPAVPVFFDAAAFVRVPFPAAAFVPAASASAAFAVTLAVVAFLVPAPPAAAAPSPPAASDTALLRPPACVSAPVAFFAIMAAAPSHIVILRANRAGTINRLGARGNGAHRPITSPRGRRAATCMRCAQLPAGYAARTDVPVSEQT